MANAHFWNGKRVLLTGHTGFKGSWLALWLSEMGAEVSGLSLAHFWITLILLGLGWNLAFIGATVISSQLARPMSRLIQPALERSITQVLEEQTHAVLPPPETSEASQPPALSDAFSGEEGQEGEEDWLAIQETLFLESVPGLADSIRRARAEGVDAGSTELDW